MRTIIENILTLKLGAITIKLKRDDIWSDITIYIIHVHI